MSGKTPKVYGKRMEKKSDDDIQQENIVVARRCVVYRLEQATNINKTQKL